MSLFHKQFQGDTHKEGIETGFDGFRLGDKYYFGALEKPVIQSLQRASKPGLRKYTKSTDIPRVINGLGLAIVSTSKGMMTDKKARAENVGGEVVCYIY